MAVWRLVIAMAVGLWMTPALATAQVGLDKASLSGTVRDQTAGVLPGADVVVTNPATGATRAVVTDGRGIYLLAALAPGTYDVRVELSGFAPKAIPAVVLSVGQRAELDVVLVLPQASALVVVEAAAGVIEPTRVAQATTLSRTEIEGLPINQRNFLDFALLTPGATAANSLATPTPTNSPSSGLSFAGQDLRSNNVTIDGADNMDPAVNAVRSTLSQDAVQEFQVLRSSFSAQFGRARGGVVNIVSKSGTNDLHGGGFAFLRDDALDTRNAFARDSTGAAVDPPFRRSQAGFTLGGPIARDRAFYFGSYEHLRRRESAFVGPFRRDELVRATASQRALFDALGASGDPQLALTAAIFAHPTSGLLNTTPATFPHTLALLEREGGAFPFASDSHTGSVRVDVNLASSHQLMARLNANDSEVEGNDVGGLRGVSSGTRSTTRNLAAVVSDTHVVSASTVNILRAQGGRFHTAVLPTDPSGPGILLGGVAQFGRDLYNPTDYAWNILQVGDTVLHSRGRHQVKVGVDLVHMRAREARAEVFLAGQFQFAEAIPLAAILDTVQGPGATAALAARLATPTAAGGLGRPDLLPALTAPISALQSYNLGLPVVYLQGFGDPTTDITYTQFGAFVQDEIRLGDRATLDVGLRYDTEWLDPSVHTAPGPVPFTLATATIADRNNLAPRIGAAYVLGPSRRTVVRGGWGLFYQNSLQVAGFSSRVLSGQITQLFLPLTGLPGITGTSADVWQRFQRDGRVDGDTLRALGLTPGTTPAVLLTGRERTPNPVSAQASAGIEHELHPDLSVSAEYTYNRGRNILRLRDVNVRAVGPNQFAVPGLDPRFLQLNVFEATGRSAYHGVSVAARKRFSRGWSMLASYTLGRARDDVTDFTLETQPDDQTNLAAEWGPSSYDQRHRLVASAVVVAPASAPSWLAHWSMAPIVTYASGRPFTLLAGYDANGDLHADTDRARLASGEPVGRNTGVGPSYFAVDARLARQLRVGARAQIGLTVEAFNLLNRTNYSGVNRVLGALPAPDGDVRGRADLAPTQPLGFVSAFAARQIQLGVRVSF